jgi:hypothetical protein
MRKIGYARVPAALFARLACRGDVVRRMHQRDGEKA